MGSCSLGAVTEWGRSAGRERSVGGWKEWRSDSCPARAIVEVRSLHGDEKSQADGKLRPRVTPFPSPSHTTPPTCTAPERENAGPGLTVLIRRFCFLLYYSAAPGVSRLEAGAVPPARAVMAVACAGVLLSHFCVYRTDVEVNLREINGSVV